MDEEKKWKKGVERKKKRSLEKNKRIKETEEKDK